LGLPQGRSRIIDHGDGTLSVATQNADGRWGVAPSQRSVPYETAPRVGLTPLEVWGQEKIYGLDAYRRVHFGNEITDVRTSSPTIGTPRAEPELPVSAQSVARERGHPQALPGMEAVQASEEHIPGQGANVGRICPPRLGIGGHPSERATRRMIRLLSRIPFEADSRPG
jgi:hypothetical protein